MHLKTRLSLKQTHHGQLPLSGSQENQWQSSLFACFLLSYVLHAVPISWGYPWAHSHTYACHTHLRINVPTLANQCCVKWNTFFHFRHYYESCFHLLKFLFFSQDPQQRHPSLGSMNVFLFCDQQHLEWLCGPVCSEFTFYWYKHQSFLRGLPDWLVENGWNEGRNSW